MPRIRAVDPFATKRVARPGSAGPTPPAETPGELARRMATALRARIESAQEHDEHLAFDATSDSSGAPWEAVSAAEALDGTVAPEGGQEPHSDARGAPDAAPVGWPTAADAAAALGVDPAEVRRRCREGELDARKDLSGAWRINPASLGAA